MLMHRHRTARQRGSPAHPLQLQRQILKAHRVVAIHLAFELQRENPFQVTAAAGHKSVAPLIKRLEGENSWLARLKEYVSTLTKKMLLLAS